MLAVFEGLKGEKTRFFHREDKPSAFPRQGIVGVPLRGHPKHRRMRAGGGHGGPPLQSFS